jgi:hypothetical protein
MRTAVMHKDAGMASKGLEHEHGPLSSKRIRAHLGDYPLPWVSIKRRIWVAADDQQPSKEGMTKRRVLDSSDSGRRFVLTHRGPLAFSAVGVGSPVMNADSEWDRLRSTPTPNRR